jgi:hypothetical protein
MRLDDPLQSTPTLRARSYRTLFLLLVLAAALATLAGLFLSSLAVRNPALQRLTAQIVCPTGEHIEAGRGQAGRLRPYQAWCVSEDGQQSSDIFVPLSLGVGVLAFVPLALAAIFWARRASAASDLWASTSVSGSAVVPPSSGVQTFQTIVVNGQTYTNVDDMPADVRQAYEKMAGLFGDANRDGMPDLFEALGTVATQMGQDPQALRGDPATRLRKLDELRASGLISEQEYQAKRAQILAEM